MNEYKQTISRIEHLMEGALSGSQRDLLHAVLRQCLDDDAARADAKTSMSNKRMLDAFYAAKRLEGCSERTISYYASVLHHYMVNITTGFRQVTTEEVRSYLIEYGQRKGVSKITVDNVRRVISSLFSWLEAEDYILKSPVRRIKKIRSPRNIKPVITDDELETMRDGCTCVRDLALVDLLTSSGMRVGELVRLNREDIDFEGRQCVVRGKGDKERRVYFDARTKVHLHEYLNSRHDENPALFISLDGTKKRLEISGVELRLRMLGRSLGLPRVHPHKFRRTMATRAIDKGMPIEQVQVLLGHSKIDTTLCYAMVDQENVKQAHRKFIA
ncbi:integrase family protein [Lancefieldella parvula DSM 20469]|uniref:Integrase family protein n=1 Tax=Lancefieldella parvula (strain ATCC 33793 / DSM 20469 / CCUG 32760 / JCM 10300 / KCTC 3663 / VPI 0546 / 1246) TaxID=521095 RepID=C8W941_LANP1|nr:site-specific tyrosine recombinase/integron integrase [Lancefieldella parvula]ACV50629.1 integrase family protein [Lancefieldella parvula DSM 20469]